MSKKSFVDVTYGAVELVSPDRKPPQKPWFRRIGPAFSAVFSVSAKIVAAVFALSLAVIVAKEVDRRAVVLEPIDLPKKFELLGLSKNVAAQRLWDAVIEIHDAAKTIKGHTTFVSQDRQLEVTEPSTGLSVQSVADFVRGLLNKPQKRVSGEFICGDVGCSIEKMELRVRVFDEVGVEIIRVANVPGSGFSQKVDAYFREAAEKILRHVDPYVLFTFYYKNDREDEALKVVDEMTSVLGADLKWGHLANGYVLIEEERYLEAIGKFKLALTLDPSLAVAYNNMGYSQFMMGQYKEAITSLRGALKLDPTYVRVYQNMGRSQNALGLYDEAIDSFQTALRLDPGYVGAFKYWKEALETMPRSSARECSKLQQRIDVFNALFDDLEGYRLPGNDFRVSISC